MLIQCTNPTCKTSIPVAEGASYVVCPVCNTWHFPSDFENAASGATGIGSMDYALPTDPSLVPPVAAPNTPSVNNPYPQYPMGDGAALPNYTPTFHQVKEPEKKEASTIACLILPDGQKYQLHAGKNYIGRKSEHLSINDPTVSRKHCIIEVLRSPLSNGGWDYLIYDIGAIEGKPSTNGVFVIGRSLRLQDTEKIQIYNGSVISLGKVRLTLQCPL